MFLSLCLDNVFVCTGSLVNKLFCTPVLARVFVAMSHVKDPGHSLINDNFTLVRTVKSTFKE